MYCVGAAGLPGRRDACRRSARRRRRVRRRRQRRCRRLSRGVALGHHHLGGRVDDSRALAACDHARRQAVSAAGQPLWRPRRVGSAAARSGFRSSARGPVLQRVGRPAQRTTDPARALRRRGRELILGICAQMARDDAAHRPDQRDRGDVERVAAGGRAVEELLRALLELLEHPPALLKDPRPAGHRLDEQHTAAVRVALHGAAGCRAQTDRRRPVAAMSPSRRQAASRRARAGPRIGSRRRSTLPCHRTARRRSRWKPQPASSPARCSRPGSRPSPIARSSPRPGARAGCAWAPWRTRRGESRPSADRWMRLVYELISAC